MIYSFLGIYPTYNEKNWIAPSADVIGDVVLGEESSIWFHATVRGDVNRIRIGNFSNIQDHVVVHVTNRTAPTKIGHYVTIGHSAVVHGCIIEDNVLVGMGAIILDHAVIGQDSIVGANALVTSRTIVPPRSLVVGSPAKVVRQLSDEEVAFIRKFADHYVQYSAIYRGEVVPDTNPFYDVHAPEH
ncbi:MAG: gamma carbonic anhydrase family protein [Bacteroidetes Order II. Incertae sedis bacterium]|nr:gamma carbonic anhydrase family protein [Bacteroidetes Order II. bacterium]